MVGDNTHHLYFISEDVRAQMLSKYMSQPDYNFDKVNRASQACGPLVKWAIAQVCRGFHCELGSLPGDINVVQ